MQREAHHSELGLQVGGAAALSAQREGVSLSTPWPCCCICLLASPLHSAFLSTHSDAHRRLLPAMHSPAQLIAEVDFPQAQHILVAEGISLL